MKKKTLAVVWLFTTCPAFANVDIFTVPDDPSTAKKAFTGNVEGSYNHQSGNSRNSTLSADSTLTWFRAMNAYSVWGEAYNYTSDDTRSSEKYQMGTRARHNLDERNFLFGQLSWLSDRFNGYRTRDTGVVGYGRQIASGPVHTLRIEAGPGVRYDEYTDGGETTRALAYGALSYSYKLTDNASFIQGLSVLATHDTTINSETGLQVNINKSFSLKLTYNYTHNSSPPSSDPEKSDTKTQISIVYNIP
ncbi:YdiY family protein [Pantoea sp. At-9b]|uniref:DUF481 domain-containing protein n=1 Tax=Pantoea sp. (strain At-9b) TaxID=592316 RepID=UPI0005A01BD7|nr:DUF481 domain-containing protein [Pantoea sp. At-9b]